MSDKIAKLFNLKKELAEDEKQENELKDILKTINDRKRLAQNELEFINNKICNFKIVDLERKKEIEDVKSNGKDLFILPFNFILTTIGLLLVGPNLSGGAFSLFKIVCGTFISTIATGVSAYLLFSSSKSKNDVSKCPEYQNNFSYITKLIKDYTKDDLELTKKMNESQNDCVDKRKLHFEQNSLKYNENRIIGEKLFQLNSRHRETKLNKLKLEIIKTLNVVFLITIMLSFIASAFPVLTAGLLAIPFISNLLASRIISYNKTKEKEKLEDGLQKFNMDFTIEKLNYEKEIIKQRIINFDKKINDKILLHCEKSQSILNIKRATDKLMNELTDEEKQTWFLEPIPLLSQNNNSKTNDDRVLKLTRNDNNF